jgi:hypothetical protein
VADALVVVVGVFAAVAVAGVGVFADVADVVVVVEVVAVETSRRASTSLHQILQQQHICYQSTQKTL